MKKGEAFWGFSLFLLGVNIEIQEVNISIGSCTIEIESGLKFVLSWLT
jgi:hypothetical protein